MKPRIALIWPNEMWDRHTLPLCYMYLIPQLLKRKYETHLVDMAACGMIPSDQSLGRVLSKIRPQIVGVSAWSHNGINIADILSVVNKVLPKAIVIIGGPHTISVNNCNGISCALSGEAEHSFPKLIEMICESASEPDLSAIPGIRYDNGRGIQHIAPCMTDDLDSLGVPDYATIGLDGYIAGGYRYRSKAERQAPILTTRGCPYGCKFCAASKINGRKVRKHSHAFLKDTMMGLVKKHNVNHINIIDDNFTFDIDYAKAFCEMVCAENEFRGLSFATPNGIRIDRTDKELFEMMKRAGWDWVVVAPETGSPRILKAMGKNLDLNVVRNRIEIAHNAGLLCDGFFILGYPGEDDESVEETISYIESLALDEISVHVFQPLRGTPVYDEMVANGEMDPSGINGQYNDQVWCMRDWSIEKVRSIYERMVAAAKGVPCL